jgi:hypothetical protein
MQQKRARDKADQDNQYRDFHKDLDITQQDILRHQDYFSAMAQTIAILIENVNMQMEAEYSDLFDRKLMSLYGMKEGKPSKME